MKLKFDAYRRAPTEMKPCLWKVTSNWINKDEKEPIMKSKQGWEGEQSATRVPREVLEGVRHARHAHTTVCALIKVPYTVGTLQSSILLECTWYIYWCYLVWSKVLHWWSRSTTNTWYAANWAKKWKETVENASRCIFSSQSTWLGHCISSSFQNLSMIRFK